MLKRIIPSILTITLLLTTMFVGSQGVYANTTTTAKAQTVNSAGSYRVTYYKIIAQKNAYYTISFPYSNDDSFHYVKLLNSKKRSIFKGYESVYAGNNFKTRIGLKKGVYYLAIKSTDENYVYNFSYNEVAENSGTTKSSAKSIYKGNSKRGIITATQSSGSGDWYKIKLTRPQYVRFSFSTLMGTGGTYGSFKLKFYTKGYTNPGYTGTFTNIHSSDTIDLYTRGYSYLQPGTYYIKVQKYGEGNGYYKLKWM